MTFNSRTLVFKLDDSFVLFLNTLSGNIDIVPNKYLSKRISDVDKKTLASRGYFSTEKFNDFGYLSDIYQNHCRNIPYWFYILTTLKCNFACPICYEKKIFANTETSSATLGKTFSFIKKFQEERAIPSDRINLVIFGGEPLLAAKKIMKTIFDNSLRNKWKIIVISNGTRVNKFIGLFNEFREIISHFRVTLDGPPEIHNMRRPYKGGRGSFADVVATINKLLNNNHQVKMQTILGAGNIDRLDNLISLIKSNSWLEKINFQWRIEGSHDYANLDPQKDEISEGKIVKRLIELLENNPELQGKIRFESFKYLGHIVHSFGWLGKYKTYWGPKFGFCDSQKGFHYVFSTDGRIYHCPRTINNPDFYIGEAESGFLSLERKLKRQSIVEKEQCRTCYLNTLCGGGCVVQRKFYPDFDCQKYTLSVVSEFIDLMKDKIMKMAKKNKIVSVNDPW